VITAETWYDANPDLLNHYQGDVISDFPFPTLPTFFPESKQVAWGVLRPRNTKGKDISEVMGRLPVELIGRAAKDCPDAWTLPGGDYIIAGCKKMRVMLVSRSCDVDKPMRKHYLIAPVTTVAELQPAQKSEEKLGALRANDIIHWFYLPPKEPRLPESFADLTQMLPLHHSFFDKETIENRLAARLSAVATSALQFALSDFYGTKFGFSYKDTCPQTGPYSCSNCFYSGQPKPLSRNVATGDRFGSCDQCGEQAIWVKISSLQ
jgi:hypothetical protein